MPVVSFGRNAASYLTVLMIAFGICIQLVAQAKPATTTALSVTASGNPVTSVTPGTVVTLIATVKTESTSLTTGQVNFCDATAKSCTDIHLLATAALTSSKTAVFKFVPGPGEHSYEAEFVANKYGAASVSSVAALSVGPAPAPVYTDTTTIAVGGSPGDYSLTATVEGFGGPAQPTGNVSFVDTSFGNTVLATQALGTSTPGLGWLISQTPAIGQYPIAEVTADFNGDGIPDLAVLWSSDGDQGPFSVTILFGKGDGTFTTGPTTQLTGIYSYPYMMAGDFNGDDKPDLAVLSWNSDDVSYVTVFLGNGNGTFGSPVTSVVFNQGIVGGDFIPGTMIAADFNGDGILDLAVVGEYVSSGGVTILLGKGDGTFAAAGSNLVPDLGLGLVAAGDFNGDGIPDLVVANYFGGSTFTVLLGKGDGTFTVAGTPLTFSNPADEFPNSIVVGDFKNEGKIDFAALDLIGVLVFLGNGDGTFSQSVIPLNAPAATHCLTGGDFNNGGELDLALLDNYDDQIDILLGAGDGIFDEIVATPKVSQDSLGPFQLVAGGFDAKGVPDLAMLTRNSSTASILLTAPTQTATATATGIAPVGAGTHNVGASYAGNSNYSTSASATVALTAGLEPVAFSLASGTYTTAQSVTLSEAIPGATIYYLASGPVSTNGFVPYAGPIALPYGGSEFIQAYQGLSRWA